MLASATIIPHDIKCDIAVQIHHDGPTARFDPNPMHLPETRRRGTFARQEICGRLMALHRRHGVATHSLEAMIGEQRHHRYAR
jgi:hypothetical protein